MTSRDDDLDVASSLPPKGAWERESALRFNRGIIGLSIAALLAIRPLPI